LREQIDVKRRPSHKIEPNNEIGSGDVPTVAGRSIALIWPMDTMTSNPIAIFIHIVFLVGASTSCSDSIWISFNYCFVVLHIWNANA
jgi:hypothetical protein